MDMDFWNKLDELLRSSEIVVDRPEGSAHPRFPDFIYPLDYGYLSGTSSADGHEIDVWLGSLERRIMGVVCTVDTLKKDSEIKILIGCTPQEIKTVFETHRNEHQGALLFERP